MSAKSTGKNNVKVDITPKQDLLRYWERKEDKQEVLGVLCALEVDTSKLSDEDLQSLREAKDKGYEAIIDWLFAKGQWYPLDGGVEAFNAKWKDINDEYYIKNLYQTKKLPLLYRRWVLLSIMIGLGLLLVLQMGLFIAYLFTGEGFWATLWQGLMVGWDTWCFLKSYEAVKYFWYRRVTAKK